MRRNILIIGFVLFVVSALTLWLNNQTPEISFSQQTEDNYTTVESAPAFSFTTLDGKKILSSELKDKIVLLHFWATWCPPCIAEFPKLLKAGETFRDDIAVIALSSDKSEADIQQFLKSHKLNPGTNIYISLDENRVVTHDLFQTFAYPETIIIDRDGNMVRKIAGDADWTSSELTDYLRSLAESK